MNLYAQWLQVAAPHANTTALVDTALDQCWTFSELQARAESAPASTSHFRQAHGRGIDFLIDTLAAWRDHSVLAPSDCPSESVPTTPVPTANVCHVKYTSGSTGTPRAVWFTAAQLAADASQIVATMGLRVDSPNLSTLSLSHSYGFSSLVLPLLLHGIPLILVPDALPGTLELALSQHTNITLPAVPAMWRAWSSAGILNEPIRLAISAGAPLTLPLEQAVYKQCHLKIHNFYGSSECGGIAFDRTTEPRTDAAFVGTAMEGVSLAIIDGRLQVSSPAVAVGYADAPDDPTLQSGSFLTSDQAELLQDNAVHLRGRSGDSINVAGRKVAPQAIEEGLLKVAGVEHAVVFGIPSKNTERVDEIVAVLHLQNRAHLESVTKQLAVPSWQRPRHWWVCQDLQPDTRGKISRTQWKERYLRHNQA